MTVETTEIEIPAKVRPRILAAENRVNVARAALEQAERERQEIVGAILDTIGLEDAGVGAAWNVSGNLEHMVAKLVPVIRDLPPELRREIREAIWRGDAEPNGAP